MDADQMTIECPVCGKKFPYDRWSDEPRSFFCSRECEDSYYATVGGARAEDLMRQRAADPNRCVICGRIMEDKVRQDKVLCSYRCQKRAQRLGINVDELRTIRSSAIRNHDKGGAEAHTGKVMH